MIRNRISEDRSHDSQQYDVHSPFLELSFTCLISSLWVIEVRSWQNSKNILFVPLTLSPTPSPLLSSFSMALCHRSSHHPPLHSHSLHLRSGLFYSRCYHHWALAQSWTPGTRGTHPSSMHWGSCGFVEERISPVYRWHIHPLTLSRGGSDLWDFGHCWGRESLFSLLHFPTLLPLALFGPKALRSHSTSVTVAACTRKTLDPHLHIRSSAVLNKDNVATGHRALAPVVCWVPNSLYGPHMLVGVGSRNYL